MRPGNMPSTSAQENDPSDQANEVSSAGSLDALAARDQSNVRPYGHKSFNQNSFNRLTVNYGASEKDTKAIRDHLEQERRERISSAQVNDTIRFIKWLKPLDVESKHRLSRRLYRESTGLWILECEPFLQWLSGDSTFLWLYGLPGAGKTILTSIVVDYLLTMETKLGSNIVVYFYCDFSNPASTHPKNLLLSLSAQVVQKRPHYTWPEKLPEIWQKLEWDQSPSMDIDQLKAMFETILNLGRLENRVFIIIDGLDEAADREDVLTFFQTISALHGVHLFIASRPEVDIRSEFLDQPQISLLDHALNVNVDIAKHIEDELRASSKLTKFPTELKAQISSTLRNRASGMFRWVQCQLLVLQSCRTPNSVRLALSNLPSSLDGTYERILKDIITRGEDDIRVAKSVIEWILGASKPMTLHQLAEALQINMASKTLDEGLALFDVQDILEVCGGLVTHTRSSDALVLSHFTVQEFFYSARLRGNNDIALRQFSMSPVEVRTKTIIRKLSYLMVDNFSAGPCLQKRELLARIDRHPMLFYTAKTWFDQGSLNVDPTEERVYVLIEQLLMDSRYLQHYLSVDQMRRFELNARGTSDGGGFTHQDTIDVPRLWDAMEHFVIRTPPWMLARVIAQHPIFLNQRIVHPGWYCPLSAATYHGLVQTVEMLINLGADLNCINKTYPEDFWPIKPLDTAIIKGREEIFNILLDRGAARDDPYTISLAARHGQHRMLTTLLHGNAKPLTWTNHEGLTLLHCAIQSGSLANVEILISHGCNVNSTGRIDKSPLEIAVEAHFESVIVLLINHGARWNAKLADISRKLQWAHNAQWVTDLMASMQEESKYTEDQFIPTPSDVLDVAVTMRLSMRLPVLLCRRILDEAEYWVIHSANREEELVFSDVFENPTPYLAITVKGRRSKPRMKISITTTSHDQGWSDMTEYHGTYNKSYSWFQMRVVKSENENVTIDNIRHHLQSNVHASSDWHEHKNVWVRATHPLWLESLDAGDRVELLPIARYPGWANWVQSAKITVMCAYV